MSNLPPDPAVLFAEEVDDLLLEARNWLDGEPIADEAQADAVSSLLNRLRRVSKDADAARKLAKKPHDEAAKAVQAVWVPIIDKCELASTAAKDALAPWLISVDEQQRAAAEAAMVEAERLAVVARDAAKGAAGNLEAMEDAERLLEAAEAARKDAERADKAKAHALGGERAVGLREVWTPTLVDGAAALAYYRTQEPDELKAWLVEQASKDVRAGARALPGFDIVCERVAR